MSTADSRKWMMEAKQSRNGVQFGSRRSMLLLSGRTIFMVPGMAVTCPRQRETHGVN